MNPHLEPMRLAAVLIAMPPVMLQGGQAGVVTLQAGRQATSIRWQESGLAR